MSAVQMDSSFPPVDSRECQRMVRILDRLAEGRMHTLQRGGMGCSFLGHYLFAGML